MIDDALKRPDWAREVLALLAHDARLRVLLTSQIDPRIPDTRDAEADRRLEAAL